MSSGLSSASDNRNLSSNVNISPALGGGHHTSSVGPGRKYSGRNLNSRISKDRFDRRPTNGSSSKDCYNLGPKIVQ